MTQPLTSQKQIIHPKANGVLLIGAGGLGCAVALALAVSQLSRIGLADPDHISISNLHRQILYRVNDINARKVTQACTHLHALSPAMQIDLWPTRLDQIDTIAAMATNYAVTIDASDNFTTRFAANDAAIQAGFPLIHGAASGFMGQLMTIAPGHSACLRCLFTAPPPVTNITCQSEGVLGPLVGETGWLMAMEAIKLITGPHTPLWNRLLTINALSGKRRTRTLQRNPTCLCQKRDHPIH